MRIFQAYRSVILLYPVYISSVYEIRTVKNDKIVTILFTGMSCCRFIISI